MQNPWLKKYMKVGFVNYPLQYRNLKQEIDLAIENVLSRGDLILRKDVEDFEVNLASFVGAKYAVGVNSCSDALRFCLMAAGIGQEDEVITVSHTFFATIEAIHHVGAKVVLIDVKEDFLMDSAKIEDKITPKTKAIIPVHLNGKICEMDKIMEIAQKHNLIVIEDAAQALGAEYQGRKAGSFGLASCFSFYPAKILGSIGDGGAVVTSSFEMAEKIKLLRNHGQKTKTEIVSYGFTSRLHNLQATVLNVKFKHLGEWIEKRREIAQIYNNGLGQINQVEVPPFSRFDVFQNYVIKAQDRDKLQDFLLKKGVETLVKDPVPNHWHKKLNLSHFSLPCTEKLSELVISLPMYPELSQDQVNYVIKCVKEFYGV